MDPIFRACTRPAMIVGIPLLPLVSITVPACLAGLISSTWLGIYGWVWCAALVIPILLTLHDISVIDDQRLAQYLQLARLALEARSWPRLGARNYSPLEFPAKGL